MGQPDISNLDCVRLLVPLNLLDDAAFAACHAHDLFARALNDIVLLAGKHNVSTDTVRRGKGDMYVDLGIEL